jgi:hypothetical protein
MSCLQVDCVGGNVVHGSERRGYCRRSEPSSGRMAVPLPTAGIAILPCCALAVRGLAYTYSLPKSPELGPFVRDDACMSARAQGLKEKLPATAPGVHFTLCISGRQVGAR